MPCARDWLDIIYFTLLLSCFIIGMHAVTVVTSCSQLTSLLQQWAMSCSSSGYLNTSSLFPGTANESVKKSKTHCTQWLLLFSSTINQPTNLFSLHHSNFQENVLFWSTTRFVLWIMQHKENLEGNHTGLLLKWRHMSPLALSCKHLEDWLQYCSKNSLYSKARRNARSQNTSSWVRLHTCAFDQLVMCIPQQFPSVVWHLTPVQVT